MSVIKYPAEIRLELIADSMECGTAVDKDFHELRCIAIEVHDMRFDLEETKRAHVKARNAARFHFYSVRVLIATILFMTYANHHA
jgi:hypothetical protein